MQNTETNVKRLCAVCGSSKCVWCVKNLISPGAEQNKEPRHYALCQLHSREVFSCITAKLAKMERDEKTRKRKREDEYSSDTDENIEDTYNDDDLEYANSIEAYESVYGKENEEDEELAFTKNL